jgi:hypothetical protein
MSHLEAPVLALALFVGMMVSIRVGRRIGLRAPPRDPGITTVETAVFAMLGLLIAFTFSSAASRFDDHRQLVVEEANDIGTAYLRLDLLPAERQPALRDLFRRYLDSRMETYRRLPDIPAARVELARSVALQGRIWDESVSACAAANSPATPLLVLPALNTMFDIVTSRTMASYMHPPTVVFGMLFALALACALLAGYGMGRSRQPSRIHMIGFAAIISGAVFVILDIEYPRRGWIRVDAVDRVLVQLRASMGETR